MSTRYGQSAASGTPHRVAACPGSTACASIRPPWTMGERGRAGSSGPRPSGSGFRSSSRSAPSRLTVFQAMSTRRHARLSVQPRLDWSVAVGGHGELSYSLVNVGFGPAILKRLELRARRRRRVGPDGPATCAEIDRRLGRERRRLATRRCFDMEGELVHPPGDIGRRLRQPARRRRAWPRRIRPRPDELPAARRPRGSYCSFYDDCWS